MPQSNAISYFWPLSKSFEGYVPWMYLDVEGLLTTGMGNLIDSVGAAQALPWRHGINGSRASAAEIAEAWNAVKSAQDHKQIGGGNSFWQNLTDLRLDDDGIQQLISGKIDSNTSILQTRFPAFDQWPAPAQLAVMLMAWAMGANFHYPNFQNAINSALPDFTGAADQSYMPDNPQKSMDYPPTSNPGLRPRNVAVKLLLRQAQEIQDAGGDYSAIDLTQLGDLSDAALALAESVQVAVATSVKKKLGLVGVIISVLSSIVTIAAGGYAAYEYSKGVPAKDWVKRLR